MKFLDVVKPNNQSFDDTNRASPTTASETDGNVSEFDADHMREPSPLHSTPRGIHF